MRGERPAEVAEASSGAGDGRGGRPMLGESVSHAVADLFARMDSSECAGLYRLVIAEVESSLLAAVMRETRGNQGQAARILGINRGTLRKKLRTYRLMQPSPQPTVGSGG